MKHRQPIEMLQSITGEIRIEELNLLKIRQ